MFNLLCIFMQLCSADRVIPYIVHQLNRDIYILSVYSHFPIELDFLFPTFLLHFFLSWTSSLSISSFCHIHIYTLQPCPSLSSNRSSAFNSKPHAFLHPVLITFPHHMSIPSQSTTSNDSCDRVNSNQPAI